jgi:hypothetical protein
VVADERVERGPRGTGNLAVQPRIHTVVGARGVRARIRGLASRGNGMPAESKGLKGHWA